MDDEPERHIRLPAAPASAAMARDFVTALASRWGFESPSSDLALVVSELVTNAVEHGGGPVDVSLHRDGEGVHVEVTTTLSAAHPRRLDPPATTSTGRGLQIVEALTAAWGYIDHDRLRTVWAQLPPLVGPGRAAE
jgi:anti-sigma regulatory factor (Ser/Thr protein kinase)